MSADTLRFVDAERVAQAARSNACEHGLAAAVAVCDADGRLLVFFKLDDAGAMAGHEAIGRAIAAAGSGGPSERAKDQQLGRASTVAAEGPGFSDRPGGLPITRGGTTIGGVGVCGGSDEQAVSCARAGSEVLGSAVRGKQ